MQYSNDGRTSGRDASRRTNTSRGSTPRGGGSRGGGYRGGSSGSYRGSSGRGDARRGGYRGSAPRGGTRGGQRDAGGARRRRSNLTGPDTGYTLHSHRVSFSRRGSFAERLATTDGRIFVVLAAIVVVVVVFAMGISSCVRSSTPAKSTESTNASADTTSTAAMSDQDGRVAAGVSNSIISQFSTELDRDEQLAQIAKRANEYTDERLLQLALDEPEAVGFVANYLDADKSSSTYTDSVTKGSVPKLFDWDERWGYVTYGDGPIAVTGSGPTTLSMAYMGLTGLNNMTAANFASLDTSSQTSTSGTSTTNGSSSSNGSSSTSGSTSSDGTTSSDSTTTSTGDSALDAMIKMATGAGLTASQLSVSSSNLTGYLSETSVIAVHLKANSLTDDEHWALAVGVDSDGSVILFDPTSSSISERTWAAGTIANYSSSFMLLSVTDESLASLQSKAGSSSSSGSSTSGTSGSGASASGTSSNGTSGASTSGTSSNGTSGTSSSGTSSSASGTSASGTSGSTSGTGSSSDTSGSSSGSGSSGSSSSGSGNYVGLTKSGN